MANLRPSGPPEFEGTVESTTDFLTTYYHGRVELVHACGKTTEVPGGKVTGDLYERHVCGPIGSDWDSAHVAPTDATEPQRLYHGDLGRSTLTEAVAIAGMVACMYGILWVFAQ